MEAVQTGIRAGSACWRMNAARLPTLASAWRAVSSLTAGSLSLAAVSAARKAGRAAAGKERKR